MNYIKDSIQNKEQTKETHRGQLLSLNQKEDFVFLRSQKERLYVLPKKKAQKLLMASYMITNFLSDNEPLKWNIREKSISILSHIEELSYCAAMSDTKIIGEKILSEIENIESLLYVAHNAGFLSDMNFAVLKEEYDFLVTSLNEKISLSKEGFAFSSNFFGADIPSDESKGHNLIKDKKESDRYGNLIRIKNDEKIIKDNLISSLPAREETQSTGTTKKIEKTSRKERILELLQGDVHVSIKDIVSHFSDCGEKTIQRELATLVQTGVLKKTGDRRWSKYSLSLES